MYWNASFSLIQDNPTNIYLASLGQAEFWVWEHRHRSELGSLRLLEAHRVVGETRPTQVTCHGQTGTGRKKPVGPDWGNNGRSQSCQRVLSLGPCFLYYKSVRQETLIIYMPYFIYIQLLSPSLGRLHNPRWVPLLYACIYSVAIFALTIGLHLTHCIGILFLQKLFSQIVL